MEPSCSRRVVLRGLVLEWLGSIHTIGLLGFQPPFCFHSFFSFLSSSFSSPPLLLSFLFCASSLSASPPPFWCKTAFYLLFKVYCKGEGITDLCGQIRLECSRVGREDHNCWGTWSDPWVALPGPWCWEECPGAVARVVLHFQCQLSTSALSEWQEVPAWRFRLSSRLPSLWPNLSRGCLGGINQQVEAVSVSFCLSS